MDVAGFVRDVESLKRFGTSAEQRDVEEIGEAQEYLRAEYDRVKPVGEKAADVLVMADSDLEKELRDSEQALLEEHGIDASKEKLTLSERLKWLVSGEARRLLKEHEALLRERNKLARRDRIMGTALRTKPVDQTKPSAKPQWWQF